MKTRPPVRAMWICASLLLSGAGQAAPSEGTVVSPQRARSLYILHCAGCHRIDGGGAPAFGVPSMIDTLGQFVRTPQGRAFLVQAPGARNASVSDAELAAMTNWQLRAFSSKTLPAGFTPYSSAEVGRWRGDPPLDVAGARAAIVATFPTHSDMTNKKGDKHD